MGAWAMRRRGVMWGSLDRPKQPAQYFMFSQQLQRFEHIQICNALRKLLIDLMPTVLLSMPFWEGKVKRLRLPHRLNLSDDNPYHEELH